MECGTASMLGLLVWAQAQSSSIQKSPSCKIRVSGPRGTCQKLGPRLFRACVVWAQHWASAYQLGHEPNPGQAFGMNRKFSRLQLVIRSSCIRAQALLKLYQNTKKAYALKDSKEPVRVHMIMKLYRISNVTRYWVWMVSCLLKYRLGPMPVTAKIRPAGVVFNSKSPTCMGLSLFQF